MPQFNRQIPKSSLPNSQRANSVFQVSEITDLNYEKELNKAMEAGR